MDYGVDAGFVASLSYCVAGSADQQQQQLKTLVFHHRLWMWAEQKPWTSSTPQQESTGESACFGGFRGEESVVTLMHTYIGCSAGWKSWKK